MTIGGQPAEVLYAGAAPGITGLMQVNARAPMSIAPGAAPLVLAVGEASSQAGVVIEVR